MSHLTRPSKKTSNERRRMCCRGTHGRAAVVHMNNTHATTNGNRTLATLVTRVSQSQGARVVSVPGLEGTKQNKSSSRNFYRCKRRLGHIHSEVCSHLAVPESAPASTWGEEFNMTASRTLRGLHSRCRREFSSGHENKRAHLTAQMPSTLQNWQLGCLDYCASCTQHAVSPSISGADLS